MKLFSKHRKKSEKGQVFVLVAIMMVMLVAVIGMAVDTGYMYVSYSRLQRAVDAAALAGTGEFKPVVTRDANIRAAVKQMLNLNGVKLDPNATFGLALSDVNGLAIETCENNLGDPVVVARLCVQPFQKIIRITAQEEVPLFFLSVIGFTTIPISISAYATAASVDVMLALDTSDSMTYDYPEDSDMRDPHTCNVGNQCQPMEKVKSAARAFVDELYFPYDRVGVVHFDLRGYVDLALSENSSQIKTTITNLQVYEGGTPEGVLLDNGTRYYGTRCLYHRDDATFNYASPDAQNPVPPPASDGAPSYAEDPYSPCRLFINSITGGYFSFDCPMNYGTSPDPSRCGTTNISEGASLATSALLGIYPSTYPTPLPLDRVDSVWVIVLLTDGAANAAYDSLGDPICPISTYGNSQACRDKNASNAVRGSSDIDYDADDHARQMFATAHANNILIYTIGLGELVTRIPSDNVGTAPGETLLKYPSEVLKNLGKYYFAPSGGDLTPIFLAIANLITSRINR